MIKIFNFVLLVVLVILGVINLFCVSCCIINLEIFIVLLVMIKFNVWGIWVVNKINCCCVFNWNNWESVMFFIFIINDNKLKSNSRINKLIFFMRKFCFYLIENDFYF